MVSPVAGSSIPNNCFCAPIRWISDKITELAQKIFGYLVRIVVFQMGEMKTRGASIIMRIYQRLASDPREEKPFDPKRLEASNNLLVQFGGVEGIARTPDGQDIRYMTLTSAAFFAEFARRGSLPIDIVHEGRARRALLNPPLYIGSKFHASIIDIKMPDGTTQKGALLPESPDVAHKPHILQCHSPGRSMYMDRVFLWLHLAAGYDVTIWDPRGTSESTGRPSEGGYYLDADAVFGKVLEQGIPHNRIYVSGFCEGAAVAAYLKRKYHHLGVHFIASNPYTSMRDVIAGHGWMGRMAARYGMDALKDPSLNVPEDDFDNVKKLSNLPRSAGQAIFIHTDTDEMMPSGTVQKICNAFGESGPIHEIMRAHPDKGQNGHMEPPYQDPNVWRRYVRFVI